MKKCLSKILCVLLCACLMFGCGDSRSTPGEDGMGMGEESTSGREEGDGQEEKEQGGKENPDSAGDDTKRDDSNTESGSQDRKEETRDMTSSSENLLFPMLENYCERGVTLHQDISGRGESFCGIVQGSEGNIEYFTLDPLRKKAQSMIWKYILSEDGTWRKESVTWTQGIQGEMQDGRITILYGEDGYYYAYYFDESQQCHLVKQDGNSYKEIVIPEWDITVEENIHVIPGRIGVAKNGNIVMADQSYKCFIYSQDDGRMLDRIRCGWYDSMCISGNDLYIKDYETGNLLHYDVEKLEAQTPIEGHFEELARSAVLGDNIYVSCPEGIFQAKKDGNSFQRILESKKYYFSKQGGNPLNLFAVGDAFYIFFGEQKGMIKRYAPRDPNEKFLGEITVYSLRDNELIIDVIAQFMMQHPEIEVLYETGEGAEGSTTTSDRIRALNARILAGEGPDVLVLDELPAQSYLKKGILSDFSAALEEEKENITPNILANYMQGDSIYMLPIRFIFPMFLTSGQDAAIFDSLESLVSYCEGAKTPALPLGLPYSYLTEILYYNFPPKLFKEDGGVDEKGIEEFVELVKRFCDAQQALPTSATDWYARSISKGYLYGEPVSTISFMQEEQSLIFVNMSGDVIWYPDEARQRGGELLANHGMFFANGMLGINAHSKQKNLAEIFIREAFSYELQSIDTFRGGFSVHKKVLEKKAEEDYSRHILSAGKDAPGDIYELAGAGNADVRRIIELAKSVQNPVERNQMVFEIFREEICSFLGGEKSKEAAAGGIANRINLYYNE